jgi:O-antigen ligase
MNRGLEYYRSRLFWLGHFVLMIGLASSKALISFGTVFLVISLILSFVNDRRDFLSPPIQIIGFALLFIMPLISGFWSENTRDWLAIVLNKILLPVVAWAYWLAPKTTSKRFAYINLFQFGLVVIAALYSVMSYLLHMDQLSKGYLQAKTLTVLISNDHVQFSLLVFLTMVLMIKEWPRLQALFSMKTRIITGFLMIWLFIYLHILGAKTGLLLTYFGIVVYLLKNAPYLVKILALPLALGILYMAYLIFPTLKNRFHYTLYDFNQYVHGSMVNGLTDGARVLSWKAGMAIAKEHPYLGVGFGDMNDVFMQWHGVHSAQLDQYNYLQPSNEFLMYMCACGILGIFSLAIGLWWIYSKSVCRKEILFTILFSAQVLMMWYEVNISSQIAIMLFAWSICWYQYPVRNLEG